MHSIILFRVFVLACKPEITRKAVLNKRVLIFCICYIFSVSQSVNNNMKSFVFPQFTSFQHEIIAFFWRWVAEAFVYKLVLKSEFLNVACTIHSVPKRGFSHQRNLAFVFHGELLK